jgi:hypothetical protein
MRLIFYPNYFTAVFGRYCDSGGTTDSCLRFGKRMLCSRAVAA